MEHNIANKLQSIGKAFFVNHYHELKIGEKISSSEPIFKQYSQVALETRQANARWIFANNVQIEALNLIIDKQNSTLDAKIIKEATKLRDEESNKLDEKTVKDIKIKKQNGHYNLGEFNVFETMSLYSSIIMKLKSEKVIRTKKIIGDLGEYIVLEFLKQSSEYPSIRLSSNTSEAGYDAVEVDDEDTRYQIKTITQKQTGDFSHNKDGQVMFDYIVICEMNDFYQVERICRIKRDDYLEVRKTKETSSGDKRYCIRMDTKTLEKSEILYLAGRDESIWNYIT